jgi:hypothetical protein
MNPASPLPCDFARLLVLGVAGAIVLLLLIMVLGHRRRKRREEDRERFYVERRAHRDDLHFGDE